MDDWEFLKRIKLRVFFVYIIFLGTLITSLLKGYFFGKTFGTQGIIPLTVNLWKLAYDWIIIPLILSLFIIGFLNKGIVDKATEEFSDEGEKER